MTVAAPRNLRPLRHTGFRRLVAGQLTSNLGDMCYAVALPWYVLAHHGGPLLLATVLAAYGVPRTVVVAVGGHASDRWGPWTVMMGADAARAAAVGGFAAAAWTGPARALLLVPIAVVLGACEGLFLPASFSLVPRLLPADELQAGNALSSGGTQLATLAGPAVGGLLVALAGPAPAFAADAASFAASALTLAGIRRGEQVLAAAAVQPERGAAPATVRRLLRSEPILWVVLTASLVANLGSGGLSEVALPALAHGPLHAGAAGYGGLVAAFGGGALAGTLLVGVVRPTRRPAIIGSAVFVGQAAVMAAGPYLGGAVGLGAALAMLGACNGFGNVIMITAFQHWAPPEALGRLMGVLMLASFGVFPLSVLLAGVVTRTLGAAAFFPLAAAPLAVAMVGALAVREWRQFETPGSLELMPDG